MANSKKLADFENEYFNEIKSYIVTEKDLVEAKVPSKVLAYEVYLRRIFGDNFANENSDNDYDENAKRKVEKLSKESLDNSELNNILNDISNSEFDANLDIILKSKNK